MRPITAALALLGLFPKESEGFATVTRSKPFKPSAIQNNSALAIEKSDPELKKRLDKISVEGLGMANNCYALAFLRYYESLRFAIEKRNEKMPNDKDPIKLPPLDEFVALLKQVRTNAKGSNSAYYFSPGNLAYFLGSKDIKRKWVERFKQFRLLRETYNSKPDAERNPEAMMKSSIKYSSEMALLDIKTLLEHFEIPLKINKKRNKIESIDNLEECLTICTGGGLIDATSYHAFFNVAAETPTMMSDSATQALLDAGTKLPEISAFSEVVPFSMCRTVCTGHDTQSRISQQSPTTETDTCPVARGPLGQLLYSEKDGECTDCPDVKTGKSHPNMGGSVGSLI